MKLKHLVIFAILLAILVVAVVFKTHQKPAELTTEEYAPLNLSFDSAKVSRIEIGKETNPKIVEIVKNNAGEWVLPTFFGARAEEKKIQELFKTFPEAKGELRAKDKALFPDFGLTEDKAYRIAFLDASAKPVFTLLVGPKITQYASAFVRKADSDQIFYVGADIFGKLGIYEDPEKATPGNEYWASGVVAAPKADLIDSLEIQRTSGAKQVSVAHVRRETDPNDLSRKWWKFMSAGAPFSPDAAKIKQFFKVFETSPASKALDPKAKDYGFSSPRWQMKIHQDNGQEIVITAGAEDPATQGTYLQVTGEPVVFLLPKYYFTNLDVDNSKFFADNPLSVDAEKVEKILIRTPSREVTLSPKTEKREAVTKFMEALKGFKVSKMVMEPGAKPKFGAYWIEIQNEGDGKSLVLDVEESKLKEKTLYTAQLRGVDAPFEITESTFKGLFGNLESLQPLSGGK